jgi:hypothetical protein
VAGALILPIAPEQRRQMFAAGAVLGMHCQIGEQCLPFARGDSQLGPRTTVGQYRKPTQYTQVNTREYLPFERAHEETRRTSNQVPPVDKFHVGAAANKIVVIRSRYDAGLRGLTAGCAFGGA